MSSLTKRRDFLRVLFASSLVLTASSLPKTVFAAPKSQNLVLYFSHSGNTRQVAQHIQQRLHADIVEIVPVKTYSTDYDTTVDRAKAEQKSNARPAIATTLPDLQPYKTIFIGYPNWWGTMPMLMFTLLENNKQAFAGKTIVPFCTHGGGGFGRSISDIKSIVNNATIASGFEIRGSRASSADAAIDDWLKKQGYWTGF